MITWKTYCLLVLLFVLGEWLGTYIVKGNTDSVKKETDDVMGISSQRTTRKGSSEGS